MRAYSEDLRQRIVSAIEAGEEKAKVAKQYKVGVATINRYLRLQREQGSLAPKTVGGSQSLVEQYHLAPKLRQQVKDHKDATLEEHVALLSKSEGVKLSVATMHRAFQRLKLTRKKDQTTKRTQRTGETSMASEQRCDESV
jgi:transposase